MEADSIFTNGSENLIWKENTPRGYEEETSRKEEGGGEQQKRLREEQKKGQRKEQNTAHSPVIVFWT